MIIEKIGNRQVANYFPPQPDRLFKSLKAGSNKAKAMAFSQGYHFFHNLQRMSEDEREMIFQSFVHGCPAELPENIHINVDLLRRITEFPLAKIHRLTSGLSSSGFKISYRTHHEHEEGAPKANERLLVIEWHDMSTENDVFGNATDVASAMILGALEDFCEKCGIRQLRKLDFSQLATVTTSAETRHISKRKATA